MEFKVKLIIFSLILLTAAFETVGAYGSGIFWDLSKRFQGGLLATLGFGGSIAAYVLMRKYIPDLAIGQAVFIGGTAFFAVVTNFVAYRNFKLDIIIGILFLTAGAIFINRALPE